MLDIFINTETATVLTYCISITKKIKIEDTLCLNLFWKPLRKVQERIAIIFHNIYYIICLNKQKYNFFIFYLYSQSF